MWCIFSDTILVPSFISHTVTTHDVISYLIWTMDKREYLWNNDGCRKQLFSIVYFSLIDFCSDLWNRLDFISLLLYVIIVILRVTTLIMSGSVANNRALVIAGYLYSLNTLCLTFRVIGHVMEQSRDVGTIQIALFSILKDISAVVWQFTATILAFSIAITKVYMAEKSFVANERDDM